MKKITTYALVITLTTILFSCQKQKDLSLPVSETATKQTSINKLEPLPPVRVPFILSEWFSVTLRPDKDGGLYGSYTLIKPLSVTADTDVKLAYVRRTAQGPGSPYDGYSFSQLPADFITSDGYLANMNFDLGTYLFEIFVRPIDIIPTVLDPNDFKDCAYRYIVISKEVYDGLHIDWSNYKEVSSILNFTP